MSDIWSHMSHANWAICLNMFPPGMVLLDGRMRTQGFTLWPPQFSMAQVRPTSTSVQTVNFFMGRGQGQSYSIVLRTEHLESSKFQYSVMFVTYLPHYYCKVCWHLLILTSRKNIPLTFKIIFQKLIKQGIKKLCFWVRMNPHFCLWITVR
jgi:hypothetical protein